MDSFQQAIDYISNIDNSNNISQQTNVLHDITLEQCENKKIELEQHLTNLNNLEIIIQNTKENINQFIQKIGIKKNELIENAKTSHQCKNIDELCNKVSNPNQVAILNRIITDKEYSKIYLNGYEPNTDILGKKKDLIGTVKVLGTFNEKKNCREEYEIRLFKNNVKGMFWCSCADHKFNSTKKNIICKHICFLICKIAKVLKPKVFEEKKLSEQDLANLLAKLTASGDIWKDETIVKICGKITLETFTQFIKAIDDCCPVCYNDLEEANKPELLSCPTCKNYIHTECANIWLEQKQSCVWCKSEIWKNYNKVKLGGYVSITQ